MAVIGIDLGTTNSVGAYYDGKEPRILRSSRADGLVPSIVVFRKKRGGSSGEGEFIVGQPAADYAFRDPENAILSIKRLMGRNYGEPKVEEVRGRVNYSIVQSSDGNDPGVRVLLGAKEYSPVDISAMIIRQIRDDAEKALGEKVTHAVITVPAYFEERQRAATRQAGEAAGLVVKKIIDEPSAAAIAYGFTVSKGERKKLLVFDLGGGTFDVSIIMSVMDPDGKNHFEVLEIRGDNWLGGDDFDRAIMGDIFSYVQREYDFNPSGDKTFQFLTKQAAERAKIALSNADEADITLPAAYKISDGPMVDLDLTLTRSRFDELIQPYVDRCMKHVHEALHGQGFEAEDIDVVLMVGGATLVPLVYDSVANYFGQEKVKQVTNPFHSVALGAGVLAATLQGIQCPNEECRVVNDESAEYCVHCKEPLAAARSVGDKLSITEATAVAFGINAVREDRPDAFEQIIPKGTVYPLRKPLTQDFETTADNFIRIPVYEGVEQVCSKNEKQGDIELNQQDFDEAGERVPAGTTVTVAMNYTRDRELHVRVEVHGTKIVKEMKLRHDRPRQVGVVAKEQDGTKWSEELDQLIRTAEHFRGRYESFMELRERRRLANDVDRATRVLDGGNPQEMQDACQMLMMSLDSCGAASLLFMAERVQSGASPERARKMGEAVREVKKAWGEGDKQSVTDLTMILRAAISAELSARQNQKEIPGQKDFGGRLRVRGT